MPALGGRVEGTGTGAAQQQVGVLPEKAGSPERGRLALAVDPLVACGLVVFLGRVRLVAAGNGAGREVAGAAVGRLLGRRPRRQTGRASFRERVCQYV